MISQGTIGSVGCRLHQRDPAQNPRSGAARIASWMTATCRQIGGSARCYQAIFVPSTALASPGYDGQPAEYLYIAALEVNVLNCRNGSVWSLSLAGDLVSCAFWAAGV
jgi:hypothetical protein